MHTTEKAAKVCKALSSCAACRCLLFVEVALASRDGLWHQRWHH